MGRDHSHHAPVLTYADPAAGNRNTSSNSSSVAPSSGLDGASQSDDDEGGCRGYPAGCDILNNNTDTTKGSNNHGDVLPSQDDPPTDHNLKLGIIDSADQDHVKDHDMAGGHAHGHGDMMPKLKRVASPVLSRDYAVPLPDGGLVVVPLDADAAAGDHHHMLTSTDKEAKTISNNADGGKINAPPAINTGNASKSNNEARRPSILLNAHEGGNYVPPPSSSLSATSNARGRAVGAGGGDVNASAPNQGAAPSPGNPRLKALKNLVRSSSEPGMSRKGNGNTGSRSAAAAAHKAANQAGAGGHHHHKHHHTITESNTKSDADANAHDTGNSADDENEKAGAMGEKVFTVGNPEVSQNNHTHGHTHAPQTRSRKSSGALANFSPRSFMGSRTNSNAAATSPVNRRGAGADQFFRVGQMPLARSSEPYLPSSRTRTGLFDGDDIEMADAVNGGGDGGGVPPGGPGITSGANGGGPTLTFTGLLEPDKPLKPPPTWKTSAWNILTYSWLNVMLVFIPVSWACHYAGVGDTAVFCVSFAAIIPLAALLGFATEELALRVGHTLGGLMNATFGNTVELIISILALVKGELRIVQAAMIGSILSNCLLVLGCCFFVGGIRFHEQIYTIRSAQLNIGLLGISALVIVIPAAFNAAVVQLGTVPITVSDRDILKLSRGVAFILLFLYSAYLFFQFWTHSYLYRAAGNIHHRSLRARSIIGDDEPQPPTDTSVLRIRTWHSSSSSDDSSDHSDREDNGGNNGNNNRNGHNGGKNNGNNNNNRDVEAEAESPATSVSVNGGRNSVVPQLSPDTLNGGNGDANGLSSKSGSAPMTLTNSVATSNTSSSSSSSSSSSNSSDDEELETPKLKVQAALILIVIVTVITGLTAEWLVDSIDGLTESNAISREFVALILLPLVGNAAEHVTAVTVSYKDKLDLSMAVAVGSSIQISLFVIPILVLLGWCIGQPLTLEFDILEVIILFVSIIIVNQAISDGKTNWMEGLVLMITYVTIALAVWYYPGAGL